MKNAVLLYMLYSIKGQSIVEYFILASFFFLLLLCIFQIILLLRAHICIKHAAYQAARSFIVNVNTEPLKESISKMEKNAAIALLSICSAKISLKKMRPASMHLNADLLGLTPFFGINPLELTARFEYAHQHMKVTIEKPKDILQITRGTKITIRLDYFFDLNIPLAGRLFHKIIHIKNSNLMKNPLSSTNLIKISKSIDMQSEN